MRFVTEIGSTRELKKFVTSVFSFGRVLFISVLLVFTYFRLFPNSKEIEASVLHPAFPT